MLKWSRCELIRSVAVCKAYRSGLVCTKEDDFSVSVSNTFYIVPVQFAID